MSLSPPGNLVRIVLDECLNPRVQHLFEADHTILTVLGLGWGGLPDNVLVNRLQGRCEAFLTIDLGFAHQHHLPSSNLAS